MIEPNPPAGPFCGAVSPAGTSCVSTRGHGRYHYDGCDYWSSSSADEVLLGHLVARPTEPAEETANQLAGVLASIGEVIAPVREATDGYRASLIAGGYPEADASRMAADYHRYVLELLTTSAAGGGDDARR